MLKSENFTATTTPTAVFTCTVRNESQGCLIKNTSATVVYVGGANVSSTNGYPLSQGDSISVTPQIGEIVYIVTAASTSDVRMLTNYRQV